MINPNDVRHDGNNSNGNFGGGGNNYDRNRDDANRWDRYRGGQNHWNRDDGGGNRWNGGDGNRGNKNRGGGGIPDRWEDYTKMGTVIPGTPFVAMKVPLKQDFYRSARHIVGDEQFTPASMVAELRERGMNLGILIDLTYTKRYYNPEDFVELGVIHKKIFVEGHEIPNAKVVEEFFSTVDEFMRTSPADGGEKSSSSRIVGVHCTHGINRTGYLVCRYLIDRLGWTAEKAIREFGAARGHKIERENYLEALKKSRDELSRMKRESQASSSHETHSPSFARTSPPAHRDYYGDRYARNNFNDGYSNRYGHDNDHRSHTRLHDRPYHHHPYERSDGYRWTRMSRWDNNGSDGRNFGGGARDRMYGGNDGGGRYWRSNEGSGNGYGNVGYDGGYPTN